MPGPRLTFLVLAFYFVGITLQKIFLRHYEKICCEQKCWQFFFESGKLLYTNFKEHRFLICHHEKLKPEFQSAGQKSS